MRSRPLTLGARVSIANINSLNSEASSKSDTAAVQVRETKDPKLLKTLLALASQLVSGERGKTTRVVVDRVERVRNDPLSIVFKRHSKTLEVTAGEETQIVQRLYVPLVDPYAQPQRTGASKSSGAAGAAAAGAAVDPVTVLVNDGFQSCVRDGAFGRGVYFPSELRVRSTDNKVFRAVCCDVAIGKRIDSGSSTSGGSASRVLRERSGKSDCIAKAHRRCQWNRVGSTRLCARPAWQTKRCRCCARIWRCARTNRCCRALWCPSRCTPTTMATTFGS